MVQKNGVIKMDKSEFIHVLDGDKIEEIRKLFLEYARSLEIDLDFHDFETELKTLPGKYQPPDGALILALVNGKAAGCVALRKISDDICEMKRLYVGDEYRGLGLGRKLVSIIIDEALNKNYKYMRLDNSSDNEERAFCTSPLGSMILSHMYIIPFKARFMELKL